MVTKNGQSTRTTNQDYEQNLSDFFKLMTPFSSSEKTIHLTNHAILFNFRSHTKFFFFFSIFSHFPNFSIHNVTSFQLPRAISIIKSGARSRSRATRQNQTSFRSRAVQKRVPRVVVNSVPMRNGDCCFPFYFVFVSEVMKKTRFTKKYFSKSILVKVF